MSKQSPAISVLLPVYNAGRFVVDAIQSILDQSFTDFELIIINDGSSDDSARLIKQFKDERIILIEQENQGLAASLNNGLKIARGNYIARQDNDDISLPDRFQKQFDFLEKHPDLALLGTAAVIVDENNQETGRFHRHPETSDELKYFLLFDNPFVHSSVMFRRKTAERAGRYYTGKDFFEDYHLWSGIARVAKVANLPDCLLRYREVSSGMSKTTVDYRLRVKNQSFENIKFYCSDFSDKKLEEFLQLYYGFKTSGEGTFRLFDDVMKRLEQDFCRVEKTTASTIKKIQRGQYRSFMRTYFQSSLDSEDISIFKKISIKVKRRLFLILNPDL